MMGSNEHISAQENLKTMPLFRQRVFRMLFDEAVTSEAEPKKAATFFNYNSQGVLNHFSPVDGEQVAPHAPSREEYNKRLNNRSYRLEAEKTIAALTTHHFSKRCVLTAFDKLIHNAVIDAYNSNGCSVSRTSRELGLHRSVIYRHLRFANMGAQ